MFAGIKKEPDHHTHVMIGLVAIASVAFCTTDASLHTRILAQIASVAQPKPTSESHLPFSLSD
jgi:hypothetical protein